MPKKRKMNMNSKKVKMPNTKTGKATKNVNSTKPRKRSSY